MKLTSNLLLSFILLASNAATHVLAAPNPASAPADEVLKAKTALIEAPGRVPSPNARATVTGTVNANNVRYRECPYTSCTAIGQYQKGHVITIECLAVGEVISGWKYWDLMTNGYYISDYYVDWTGGVPDDC